MLEGIILGTSLGLSVAAFAVALHSRGDAAKTAKLTSDGFIAAIDVLNFGYQEPTHTAQKLPLDAPDLPESDVREEDELVDPFYAMLDELGSNPDTHDQVAGMYHAAKRAKLI